MIDIVFIFILADNKLHMRNKSSNLHGVCCSNNSPSLGFCNTQLSLLLPLLPTKTLTPVFRVTELVQVDGKLMTERKRLGHKGLRPNYIKHSYITENIFAPTN
jgi:hypothetical protein